MLGGESSGAETRMLGTDTLAEVGFRMVLVLILRTCDHELSDKTCEQVHSYSLPFNRLFLTVEALGTSVEQTMHEWKRLECELYAPGCYSMFIGSGNKLEAHLLRHL